MNVNRIGQALLGVILLAAAGCITVGRDFSSEMARKVVNGTTTREQLLSTFGEPYQKGVDNGKEAWTYYKVRYRGSSAVQSKELYVIFNPSGVVESHSFNETAP